LAASTRCNVGNREWLESQSATLSRHKRRSEAGIQIDRDNAQIEPAPLRDPVQL